MRGRQGSAREALVNILKGVDKDGLLTTNQIIDFIEEQPTAFDEERVLEELQRHAHNYYPSIDCYCLSRKAVDLKEAIEIVKKGGIE